MAIRCILSSQVKGPPLKGPLFLQCNCYFEIPNSWSKKRRQNAIEGKELHQSKPDIDNLLKFYADCLTDIAYDDDRQIVSVNTNKYYAEESYTLLIVTSLDGSPDAPKSIIGQ
jgi:Holliday junction resolvase RusA-like endonuclease